MKKITGFKVSCKCLWPQPKDTIVIG